MEVVVDRLLSLADTSIGHSLLVLEVPVLGVNSLPGKGRILLPGELLNRVDLLIYFVPR